jgi:hypothetical protein
MSVGLLGLAWLRLACTARKRDKIVSAHRSTHYLAHGTMALVVPGGAQDVGSAVLRARAARQTVVYTPLRLVVAVMREWRGRLLSNHTWLAVLASRVERQVLVSVEDRVLTLMAVVRVADFRCSHPLLTPFAQKPGLKVPGACARGAYSCDTPVFFSLRCVPQILATLALVATAVGTSTTPSGAFGVGSGTSERFGAHTVTVGLVVAVLLVPLSQALPALLALANVLNSALRFTVCGPCRVVSWSCPVPSNYPLPLPQPATIPSNLSPFPFHLCSCSSGPHVIL